MSESMQGLKRTHRCGELSLKQVGEQVTVMGWVQKNRNKGGLIFIDLRDRSGLVQLVLEEGVTDAALMEKAAGLHAEYVIAAVGTVNKRGGAVNDQLATGQIEIAVEELRVLAEAETPPFQVEQGSKTKEELRLQYRYLDLRRPDLQKNFILRHRVTTLTRQFLEGEGFLDIETPVLCKSTPEGARDYLVPSRIHQGEFYALPQSPQIFKQLLMCSGFDRYMQIAKCFRDEDLRADRQPEFTQIDLEMSFVDVDDVIDVNSRLLAYLFKEILDVEVPLPIPRMTWQEAMDRFGSDKPDLRFGMELTDLSETIAGCGFGVFENAVADGGSVRAICVQGAGGLGRKKIDKLVDFVRDYGAGGLAYIQLAEDGNRKVSFAKFVSEKCVEDICRACGIDGDLPEGGALILIAAGKNKVVWDSLGALRVHMARQMEMIDESRFEFLWVVDFPQFEWSDEEGRFMAMHHPFTMPYEEDIQYLKSDPARVRAKAYDIVLNGCELGGGSIRISRADVQEKMFEALGFTPEQAHERFGFLLNAFKYGVPPHGGLAYGLDRMVMLMTGGDSIRDCIAFPKVKDASDLMSQAPSPVDATQLAELGIDVVQTDEAEG